MQFQSARHKVNKVNFRRRVRVMVGVWWL